jgi:hypothetical protein
MTKDKRTALNGVELQHRHFAFIAHVISELPDHAASLRAQKASVASAFAAACKATNPRFDNDRFLRACNLTGI